MPVTRPRRVHWLDCAACGRVGTWWELNSLACTHADGCALDADAARTRREEVMLMRSQVFELLDVETGELADMFRHEAARVLRACAWEIEKGSGSKGNVDKLLARAASLLTTIDMIEFEWEREHADDPPSLELAEESDEASDATEATPRAATPAPHDGTIPEHEKLVSTKSHEIGTEVGDR